MFWKLSISSSFGSQLSQGCGWAGSEHYVGTQISEPACFSWILVLSLSSSRTFQAQQNICVKSFGIDSALLLYDRFKTFVIKQVDAGIVSDSWRSGLRSWRLAGGQRCEPLCAWWFFFVRIHRTRWKYIFHRDSPHSPQKDVRNMQWKFFFHRISYENLPPNLGPGG